MANKKKVRTPPKGIVKGDPFIELRILPCPNCGEGTRWVHRKPGAKCKHCGAKLIPRTDVIEKKWWWELEPTQLKGGPKKKREPKHGDQLPMNLDDARKVDE